jgi:hypothetical protein
MTKLGHERFLEMLFNYSVQKLLKMITFKMYKAILQAVVILVCNVVSYSEEGTHILNIWKHKVLGKIFPLKK